jgi:hypothetical protein
VMVKSEAKGSIVVDECVVRELREAMKLSEAERLVHALLLHREWRRVQRGARQNESLISPKPREHQ